MKPSNVLILFSDQHARRVTGCYGDPVDQTPTMDRLAREGTLFTNAYTPAPICVPARASLATGRQVYDIGYWDNAKAYDGAVPSWGHRLMAQGHRVTSIGKLHYRRTEDPTGFHEQINPMHVVGGVGMLFTILRDPIPVSKAFPLQIHNAGGGSSTYSEYDADITRQTVRWLKEEAPKHRDKPWVLFSSLVCPHPPFIAPEPFYSQYPHEAIPWPKAYGKGERPDHPAFEDLRRFFGVEEAFDEATVRRARAAYYGLVSYLDANIRTILQALEETGLAETTRIVYTSDHGESMGQKGLFSKCNFTEEAAGIPMILSGPDVPRGQVVDTPCSLIDVFPTVLEGAGATFTAEDRELPGTSLFALAKGERPPRVVLSEQHSAGAKNAGFMIRQGSLKYVYYVGYPEQLYDLASDPEESINRVGDPAYELARQECYAALRGLLDPEEVDAKAKADQARRLEMGGGAEAIRAKGSPGYTPAPGEAPQYIV